MIEYHADDYGLFKGESEAIIDCYHNGALNGISIMPNSPYLKECMDAIEDIRSKLFVTVHINLVEGVPITGQKAGRLTDKDGNFDIGFGKLLLFSYIPVLHALYYRQIRREVEAQIEACRPYMNDGIFRIDGHMHYHMLPVVFDAIMDVIQQKNLKVSYIRFPKEEISVYKKLFGRTRDLKPINFVKVAILNLLSARNHRKYREELISLKVEEKLFMGVMLSGHMFYENVKECIPVAAQLSADKGINGMEVLFHPGAVTDPEEAKQITGKSDYGFFTTLSANRKREGDALKAFGGNLRR